VIVRLVTSPPTAIKAHDPPEKVGHRGAKTALLLHHFGGVSSRCDGPELVTPKATTAVEVAQQQQQQQQQQRWRRQRQHHRPAAAAAAEDGRRPV